MAYSVPVLEPAELSSLQKGTRTPAGNIALIAAGTGLGTSFLHYTAGRYVPVASEGGHTDFAARTDREIDLMRFLRSRFGRAEVEQVLSGPGLINLAEFTHTGATCAAGNGTPTIPANVSAAALDGTCAHCAEALDLLVSAYGAVAGNFALAAVTRAGVFIGGGIAPRILPALQRGGFLAAFNAKEPMDALLRAMPVDVILNDTAGLLGAAVYAASLD
jgi:glucokinase